MRDAFFRALTELADDERVCALRGVRRTLTPEDPSWTLPRANQPASAASSWCVEERELGPTAQVIRGPAARTFSGTPEA